MLTLAAKREFYSIVLNGFCLVNGSHYKHLLFQQNFNNHTQSKQQDIVEIDNDVIDMDNNNDMVNNNEMDETCTKERVYKILSQLSDIHQMTLTSKSSSINHTISKDYSVEYNEYHNQDETQFVNNNYSEIINDIEMEFEIDDEKVIDVDKLIDDISIIQQKEELNAKTVKELKLMCQNKGLYVSGKKEQLIHRLLYPHDLNNKRKR